MKKEYYFVRIIEIAVVFLITFPAPSYASDVVTIYMRQSPGGAKVYFDPIGVNIQPGQTVRWIQLSNYHSVTAYHPSNGNYALRIPEGAEPWDSGILTKIYPKKGSIFEHRFTVEGVYDYFCRPHEAAGMVGRIVVGSSVEEGSHSSKTNDKDRPAKTQLDLLPSVQSIISKGVVIFDVKKKSK